MGYTGGAEADPTYHNLGNHTETIQIDFDPEVVTYGELLDLFWKSHSPAAPERGTQYMAAIFYHDEEQRRLSVDASARLESELGRTVTTRILPASRFYRAEDYHQKYRLRRHAGWMRQLESVYADPIDFTDSTAAARLNGVLGGFGTEDQIRAQLAPLEV